MVAQTTFSFYCWFKLSIWLFYLKRKNFCGIFAQVTNLGSTLPDLDYVGALSSMIHHSLGIGEELFALFDEVKFCKLALEN